MPSARDSFESLKQLNEDLREHGDKIVASDGGVTTWASDPGPDQRRVERTKQLLTGQNQQQEDPAPHLSDDEVFRRLGLG